MPNFTWEEGRDVAHHSVLVALEALDIPGRIAPYPDEELNALLNHALDKARDHLFEARQALNQAWNTTNLT